MNSAKQLPSGRGLDVLLVLGSIVSLQFGAAFAIELFPHTGAWGATTLRLGIAAIIMIAITRPKVWRWNRKQWVAVLLFGMSMGCMNGTFFNALGLIPLGLAVAVEFTGPLVLSVVLSHRPIDILWSIIAAAGLGILGFQALSGASDINLLGVLLALAAGLFWAFYILTSAKTGEVLEGSGGLAVALGIGALILIPLGGADASTVFADPKLFFFAVAVALLSSVLPYSLELAALRTIPRNVFSILLSLEPAVAALAGWVLLDQPSDLGRWIAISLLICASIGITKTAPRTQKTGDLALTEVSTLAIPIIELEQHPESKD